MQNRSLTRWHKYASGTRVACDALTWAVSFKPHLPHLALQCSPVSGQLLGQRPGSFIQLRLQVYQARGSGILGCHIGLVPVLRGCAEQGITLDAGRTRQLPFLNNAAAASFQASDAYQTRGHACWQAVLVLCPCKASCDQG